MRKLGYLLPLKRLQIQKPLDSAGRSRLIMKLVGAGLSEESTNCAAKLVEGILSVYSLQIISVSKTEGILEVVAE